MSRAYLPQVVRHARRTRAYLLSRTGAAVGGEGALEQDLVGVGESEEEISELVGQRRRSWARLLRRIYEVDPLVCPCCDGELKIVSVITDPVVIRDLVSRIEEFQWVYARFLLGFLPWLLVRAGVSRRLRWGR